MITLYNITEFMPFSALGSIVTAKNNVSDKLHVPKIFGGSMGQHGVDAQPG